MCRSIALGDMVTVGALLAGMTGIDEDHRDTGECGLVRHVLPELEESPIGVPWALLASGLNPLPDARQIFEGKGCTERCALSTSRLAMVWLTSC